MSDDIQQLVEHLQQRLAMVDLTGHPRAELRVLLLKLQKLKIKMYQEKGHALPHVHIDYGTQQHVASYSVDDGARLAGNLSSKYDHAIGDWINQNRDKLLEAWETMQSGRDLEAVLADIRANA